MYTVSDIVEMGKAQEQILSLMKDWLVGDDTEPCTLAPETDFDE
jgi:hypothetical protein